MTARRSGRLAAGMVIALAGINLALGQAARRFEGRLSRACARRAAAAEAPALAEARAAVGTAREVNALQAELAKLVKRHGLASPGITFTQGAAQGPYRPVGFTIPVDGPYPAVWAFIGAVERLRALLTIQSVHLTRATTESARIGLEVRAVTYMQ